MTILDIYYEYLSQFIRHERYLLNGKKKSTVHILSDFNFKRHSYADFTETSLSKKGF